MGRVDPGVREASRASDTTDRSTRVSVRRVPSRPDRASRVKRRSSGAARDRATGPRAARQADRPRRLRQRQPVVVGLRDRGDPPRPDRSRARGRGLLQGRARSRSRCSACSAILLFSYRQTIRAYPQAGGAYLVTRDNFGILPAQVAGVALLTDYILTVSVSVAAGTAALTSIYEASIPWRVPIWLGLHRHHHLGEPPWCPRVGADLRASDVLLPGDDGGPAGHRLLQDVHRIAPRARLAVPDPADGDRSRASPWSSSSSRRSPPVVRPSRESRRSRTAFRPSSHPSGRTRSRPSMWMGSLLGSDVHRPVDPGRAHAHRSRPARDGHRQRADRSRRLRRLRSRVTCSSSWSRSRRC